MQSEDQIRRLHRHIMAGRNFDVACAGDGVGDGFRERRRAHAIELPPITSTGQRSLVNSSCMSSARQHPPDRRIARRIVAEPSRPVSLKAPEVAAKLRGIAIPHRIRDGERHAGGLDPGDAFEGRRAAIRRDAGSRAADRDGAGALRVSGSEMKRDRPADGDTRQRDLAGDPERIEQRRDIVGHRIDAKLAAHLLRHSGPSGVIAQYAAGFREPRCDVVPALERAAHFVHQHQRAVALAAQFVA